MLAFASARQSTIGTAERFAAAQARRRKRQRFEIGGFARSILTTSKWIKAYGERIPPSPLHPAVLLARLRGRDREESQDSSYQYPHLQVVPDQPPQHRRRKGLPASKCTERRSDGARKGHVGL